MLTTASRLHSAPADKDVVAMFGRGGQQSAGCRKTCGQGAKRTQILAMGCSTPGLALWRGCLACRVNGGFCAVTVVYFLAARSLEKRPNLSHYCYSFLSVRPFMPYVSMLYATLILMWKLH